MNYYPPLKYLRECFIADLDAGTLTWRQRPRSHFPSDHAWRSFNARYPGKLAGSGTSTPRRVVNFPNKRQLSIASIIYALYRNRWFAGHIRFKDGNQANCVPANLAVLPYPPGGGREQLYLCDCTWYYE